MPVIVFVIRLPRHAGVLIFALGFLVAGDGIAQTEIRGQLDRLLNMVTPQELVPGATAFGAVRQDLPIAPVLEGDKTVAWAFATSDFVSTIGYSGKPIHTLVAIDENAILTGVRLVEHSEPIVLIGIPESRIRAATEKFAGLDIKAEAAAGGQAHDLEIISGATVTLIVIDDSVVRASIKVARALGLGGLRPTAVTAGPRYVIDPEVTGQADWQQLIGEGAVRRLALDIGQINEAFRNSGEDKAAARPEAGADDDTSSTCMPL